MSPSDREAGLTRVPDGAEMISKSPIQHADLLLHSKQPEGFPRPARPWYSGLRTLAIVFDGHPSHLPRTSMCVAIGAARAGVSNHVRHGLREPERDDLNLRGEFLHGCGCETSISRPERSACVSMYPFRAGTVHLPSRAGADRVDSSRICRIILVHDLDGVHDPAGLR